ncbi:MAG: response regulator, partial [Bdellovibrionales bacterium]
MRNAIKVLIVDDDKASAQAISEVVKRMGFKPVVTTKTVDALNVVRLQTVHAAIVDVLLPKMTGVELVGEFRKTKFADNPVIFISGVFKDRAFASETIRKTQAVGFLFKPFENEELTTILSNSMQSLLNAERWSVQSLLTRKLNSDRERAKAIENLEQIKGLDFPFVLSILMEVGSSGHLNIVNDSGEIFGVTLTKGTIAEVDSTESQSTGVLALISKGYLSQEDWDDFQKSGARKFSLEKLVQEGFVSPHAIHDARKEQILYDFRAICASQTLQVNFVPQDDNEEPPKHAVKLHDLMDLLRSSLDEFFPQDYLLAFYQS